MPVDQVAPPSRLYCQVAPASRPLTFTVASFVMPSDLPGITPGKKEDKMGQRASDTRVIHFDNVRVPASQRLGAEGEGFKIAMKTLDRTRPPIGSLATGIAQRALDESVGYAKERKAFGFPIAGFQAVQFMLADMAKDVEAAGYSGAWTAETSHDPFLPLLLAAEHTEQLELGTGGPPVDSGVKRRR